MVQTLSRGVILAVGLVFCAAVAQAQQHAALVMDARTGRIIHEENADTRVHPASLTKMMTLYIVFDQIRQGRLSLDQKITVSANAAAQPPSRLGLKAGQKIELRYLIRAAAIKSANDAATAMGDAIGGSEEGFARMMNQYARAMGLDSTSFKNANGLTRPGHMSTARDMATLGRRLVYDFPQYYNIFGRTSTSAGIATVRNTNRRVLEEYQGADGIKTGYTKAAGFNVVSSAQRGDRRVIVAVLGGRSTASRNAEAERLMDLGFSRMPATARVVAPTPLRTVAVASAAPRGSTAAPVVVARTDGSIASVRPMPRSLDSDAISRNSATIAAAIAEVNAELTAQAARNAPPAAEGRPIPRPGSVAGPVASVKAVVGSASTFAVAEPAARPAPPDPAALEVASAGTTGGNDWGVQLGAYRAKGDAERQLLTTALQDVPELAGGLRRVEAAKVRGVTVYRAQFVGLSQQDALGACAALARLQAACLPLAPGI
ncbi:serine hydrolase [uncultured Amaricoccus sp.]|uniref:serine hydrolase n=1 Tax=uncultured Amaricoccus sp. TaxID=339341 RepID=UPI00261C23BE|nr:serine hydrolase [uncultured Amaricoccus sp.]